MHDRGGGIVARSARRAHAHPRPAVVATRSSSAATASAATNGTTSKPRPPLSVAARDHGASDNDNDDDDDDDSGCLHDALPTLDLRHVERVLAAAVSRFSLCCEGVRTHVGGHCRVAGVSPCARLADCQSTDSLCMCLVCGEVRCNR
jgi:hypothetical protein